jgi:hypothetical protein
MRDDEGNIGILRRNEFHDRNLADGIVEDWNPEGARNLADLTRKPRIVAVGFDPNKTITLDA